jgi:hypothetical protein
MIASSELAPRQVSPEELATALREGLEARRMLSPPSRTGSESTRPGPSFDSLWPLAGLLGHPVPSASGIASKVVRLLRRVARKLMAPWHEIQTRFNHALLSELQAIDLAGRDRTVQELIRRIEELQGRVNECHYKIESSLARPPVLAQSNPEVEAAESVFVQTRMPEPPGHALVLSGGPTTVRVLKDIGYTVLHAPVADMYDLPLQAGAFRIILALDPAENERSLLWSPNGAAARAAVSRLLAPTGRVFGSIRIMYASGLAALSRTAAPLRIVDHMATNGVTIWAAES